jgi:hypothetical protein
MDWHDWQREWRLLDGRTERAIPIQVIPPEALTASADSPRLNTRLLFRTDLAPGEIRKYLIDTDSHAQVRDEAGVSVSAKLLQSDAGAVWEPGVIGRDFGIRLDTIDDPTDTWSHGVDRYEEPGCTRWLWSEAEVQETGPLMASVRQAAQCRSSNCDAEWRVYSGEAFLELRLRVRWQETRKILKLSVSLPSGASIHRADAAPGGWVWRRNGGQESPIHGWTRIDLGGGAALGVVCPTVFALDATTERLRLTLLRSSLMAHHRPYEGPMSHGRVGDIGEHDFLIRFYGGTGAPDADRLSEEATALQRPPIAGDLTSGMPTHVRRIRSLPRSEWDI